MLFEVNTRFGMDRLEQSLQRVQDNVEAYRPSESFVTPHRVRYAAICATLLLCFAGVYVYKTAARPPRPRIGDDPLFQPFGVVRNA